MVCRVCLEDTYSVLNIFEKSEKLYDIANILEKYLWFKPCVDDPISTAVCCDCWQSVHEFHQFYIKVEQAHSKITSKEVDVDISKVEIDKIFHRCEPEPEPLGPTISIKEELVENNYSDLSYPNAILATKDEIKDEINPYEDFETQICNTEKEYRPHMDLDVYSDNLAKDTIDVKEELLENIGSENLIYSNHAAEAIETKIEIDPVDFIKTTHCKIEIETHSSSEDVSNHFDDHLNSDVKGKKMLAKKENIYISSDNEELNDIKQHELTRKRQHSITKHELDLIAKHICMQCELCYHVSKNYNVFVEHFKNEHEGVTPSVKCCGRKLNKRFLFIQHALKHEDPEHFKCKECNKVFSVSDSLRYHMLVNHAPKEELKFVCDLCPKRFPKQHYLNLHKASHIPPDEWKFVCEDCPQHKYFASNHLLQTHRNAWHLKAANVCHVCAKEIRHDASFEKHMRLHFEESGPRLKCPHPGCDSFLKDEVNLKTHMRRHNVDGVKFICKHCNKLCKNRNALTSHILYAHSNKTYNCDLCDKSFKKAVTLKEHMVQHTGGALYQCPFCTRTFNSNANMHSHKKKIHPVDWENSRKTKKGQIMEL